MNEAEKAVERALAVHFERHFNDGTENGRLAGSQICDELKTDIMDELRKVFATGFPLPVFVIHNGSHVFMYSSDGSGLDIQKACDFINQFAL